MVDDSTPRVYRLPDEPQARAPDGLHYIPPRGIVEHLESHLVPLDATGRVNARQAACLALAQILANMTFYAFDLTTLARGQDQAALRVGLKDLAVTFDWAETQKEKTFLSFNIADDSPLRYEDMGLSGARFLEDTVDVYAPGSVLVQEGFLSGTLVVRAACNEKNHRDMVMRAVEDSLGGEPFSGLMGRRVVSRLYYDRVICLTLAEAPFQLPDAENEAARNQFELDIRVEVDTERVRLVTRPPRLNAPPRVKLDGGIADPVA